MQTVHLNKIVSRLLLVTGISFVILVIIYFLAGFSGFLSRADIYEGAPTPTPTAISAVATATPGITPSPGSTASPTAPTFTYPIEEISPSPSPTPINTTLPQPVSPTPTTKVNVTVPASLTPTPVPSTSATPTPNVAALSSTKKVLFGDIDGNGKVTASDFNTVVDKFIKQGVAPTETDLEKLDVNNDGKIDYEDVAQIVASAVNTEKVYPTAFLDWTSKPTATGDLDNDGYTSLADVSVCLAYASGSASASSEVIARGDFNGNKKIDAADCTIILRMASEAKEINPEFATREARKGSGDFDDNGILTVGEAKRITAIATGLVKVTEAEKQIADINGDGKVTSQDGTLAMIIANHEKGDVNLNGSIDCSDVERILRIGLGLENADAAIKNLGDVNNDGEINVTDAMIVLKGLQGRCFGDGVLKGDINGDGKVDIEDLKLGMKDLIGTTTLDGDALKRADMDGDGQFTRNDFNAIQATVYNNQKTSVEANAPHSGDANGDGVVTKEDVDIAKDALAGKQISQEVKTAIDMNGDGQITAADVTIIQNKVTQSTTTTTTQPTTSYILGDLNEDNKVTVSEGALVLRAAIGLVSLSEDQKKRADVNGDGKVTAADALKIIRIAIGLEPIQKKTEGQTGTEVAVTIAGDVNKDGKLDVRDATLITQYVQNPPKNKVDFALADLNNDGLINSADVEILLNMVIGKTRTGAEKTATPTPGATPISQVITKGDVNGDGKVDRNDVLLVTQIVTGLIKPTDKELRAGDMDGDGKITITDALLILRKISPAYSLGDVNGDGKVDGEDVKLALLFVTGKAQPTEQQLRAADVNNDGKITMSDVMAIQKMAIAALPSVAQVVATKVTASTAPSPQPTGATKLTTQQKTTRAVQKGLTNAGSNILSILLLSFLISIAVSGVWWALSKK